MKELEEARGVVAEGGLMMHVPSRFVGKPTRVWSGEPGDRYLPSEHDLPPGVDPHVAAPVVEFEGGHSFVVAAGTLVRLGEGEVAFYVRLQAALLDALRSTLSSYGRLISPESGAKLAEVALREQIAAIGRARAERAEGGGR